MIWQNIWSWIQIEDILHSEREFLEKITIFDKILWYLLNSCLWKSRFFFKCGFAEKKCKNFNILRMFFISAKNYCKNSSIWDQSEVSSSIRLEMRASWRKSVYEQWQPMRNSCIVLGCECVQFLWDWIIFLAWAKNRFLRALWSFFQNGIIFSRSWDLSILYVTTELVHPV